MEDKLFELLDDLNIRDTNLLLDKDINLSVNHFTRKRIEKSIKKKTGYCSKSNMLIQKINNILGGIFMKRKIALALSVCAVLILGGGTYAYACAKTPVAYVSVDINPSVELGVNAFDKVVSVEAYNEDGKKILEGTYLINYDVDNALSTLVSNAISNGYINADGSSAIEITTATDKEKVATKLEDSLKDVTDETLKNNNVQAEIETENVALARRDEARKIGITPGKLNLIQKLQEIDPTINIEDYKTSSVKDIQKKTKELRKSNESNEVSKDDSTNTDINDDVVNKDGTSVDSEDPKVAESKKNTKANNNGSVNSKKEENSSTNKDEETTTTTPEKEDNNVNSQGNSNSNSGNNSNNVKSQDNSNSNSESSKSNTQKADNSGNSNSQNKSNN